MKKVLVLIIILTIIFSNTKVKETNVNKETRSVFISYIELNEYLKDKTIEESKISINKMINNIKNTNINTIILQVRSNQDSIYLNSIFPHSEYINKKFDCLEYFVKESHNNNLKLIAWINPYRVNTKEEIKDNLKDSESYKYIDNNTYISNGIYLNPSKQEVETLILKGVDEVLNYNVDGILFDDYFYQKNDIDIEDYNKTNKDITLEEYHLQVINKMILKVHNKCKKKKILFGISPDGNIENNYNKNMADVRLWMSSNKYIDFIMPQIYYGFYNSTKDYVNVTKEWESLLKTDKVKLLIALAFYKVGIEDNYAKDGREEWINNNDIIMREVILSRNLKNYEGFALFRYDSLFDEEKYTTTSKDELENLKNIIN